MERKIRKFKRSCKGSYYGVEAKKKMDILNFQNKRYNPLESEIKCEIIKRQPLTKKIKQFPKEVQIRIYIFAMKNHWRNMMKVRTLKPMWCDYKKYLDNEIKRCIIDNVHFMHLEFNTLPEYKKWIPGCQCTFCKEIHKRKSKEYEKIVQDPNYFVETINCYDETNPWNELFLYFTSDEPYVTIRIFDHLKGYHNTVYDQLKLSPHISPIYFSKEVEELFG